MAASAPATLIVINAQLEYVTPGRPFFMDSIGPSLENLSVLLDLARASRWRIIHVRHEQNGPLFTKGSPFVDFIDGFEPLAGEPIIVKAQTSPFCEPEFRKAITAIDPGPVYVGGYGSTMCCLATMVGAPLFGHRFTFVHDASWARSPRIEFTESEVHLHATSVISLHGDIASTDEVVDRLIEDMAA